MSGFFQHRPGAPGTVVVDGVAFKADPSRGGKLLSVSRDVIWFGRNGTGISATTAANLFTGSGAIATGQGSLARQVFAHDVTVTGLIALATSVTVATIAMEVLTEALALLDDIELAVASPASALLTTVNFDVDAGDRIRARLNSPGATGTVDNPLLGIEYAVRQ